MRLEVPDEWRTEHLFVLVGGNPLPNFVAAKLLLARNGTLHLVHSPDTKNVADRIAKIKEDEEEAFPKYERHEVTDPSDASEVRRVMEDVLGNCQGASVGLHYTGGTKAMAVHAHRAVGAVTAEWGQQPVLTYLDAQTLAMTRDDMPGKYSAQYGVELELKTLLGLHDIELQREPSYDPQRSELNQALAEAHARPEGQAAYEAWCQRYLRRPRNTTVDKACRAALDTVIATAATATDDRPYAQMQAVLRASPCIQTALVDKYEGFAHVPVPYPTDPALVPVADAMRHTFGIPGDHFDPQDVIDNQQAGLNSLGDLTGYLDGHWLEHLTLAALRENEEACELHGCAMSLRTTQEPYHFEFDVAALQGYQLYTVSCTRSNVRPICKSKLFEAYVRARQLGGDEAKVGLVCCDKNPKRLEQQVTRVWGAQEGRIRVFGPHEIANLPAQFYDWLSR